MPRRARGVPELITCSSCPGRIPCWAIRSLLREFWGHVLGGSCAGSCPGRILCWAAPPPRRRPAGQRGRARAQVRSAPNRCSGLIYGPMHGTSLHPAGPGLSAVGRAERCPWTRNAPGALRGSTALAPARPDSRPDTRQAPGLARPDPARAPCSRVSTSMSAAVHERHAGARDIRTAVAPLRHFLEYAAVHANPRDRSCCQLRSGRRLLRGHALQDSAADRSASVSARARARARARASRTYPAGRPNERVHGLHNPRSRPGTVAQGAICP